MMRCLFGVVATAFLLVAACARIQMPTATPQDAQRASAQWPGTTVSQLNEGRSLYIARCSSCHQPVQPEALDPDEWPEQIDEMKARSKLDDAQATLIERYLVTLSAQERLQAASR